MDADAPVTLRGSIGAGFRSLKRVIGNVTGRVLNAFQPGLKGTRWQ